MWYFDGDWHEVNGHGYAPGTRCEHALLPVSAKELALVGGFDAEQRHDPRIHVLDVEFAYWSTPFIAGDPPRPRRGVAVANFVAGCALQFGGEPLGPIHGEHAQTKPALVALHSSTLVPTPESAPVAHKESGVSLHMGAELALEDAEHLLMHAKKEVMALEQKLHEVLKSKNDLRSELVKAQQELRDDRKDLESASSAISRAMQQVDLEKRISGLASSLAQTHEAQLLLARQEAQRYKHAVATAQAMWLAAHDVISQSAVMDELEATPEYCNARDEHHNELARLTNAVEESTGSTAQGLVARVQQLKAEHGALERERDDLSDLIV